MYEQLYNECKRYEGFMFKRCSDYIIILKQPNEDFKCNEMRKDIVNKKYAKFRCNKALVIDIIHSETLAHINRIAHICPVIEKQIITIYEVGKVVLPDYYDLDIDEVCSNGIHYFLSLEPAYHYDTNYNYLTIGYCTFSQWYSNGQKEMELHYLDSKLHGKFITWYQDGKIKSEKIFKNGEQIIKK